MDGDGAINFQEFKTLYANAPAGFFTFDHVDQERLAQIEAHAQGRAGQVQGERRAIKNKSESYTTKTNIGKRRRSHRKDE